MPATCNCLDENGSRIWVELRDSTSHLIDDLELHLRQLRQLSYPGIPFIIDECELSLREIRSEIRTLCLCAD